MTKILIVYISGGSGMEPVGITKEMMLVGRHHGANIARVTSALRGKDLLARGNVALSEELLQ
ncbi:hypothetical protein [Iningainema tapete]|uniref:Uncharacterized protein n=1 Tax=Iningainema tapete BLCC-T55 TaxID=2748662 RepID=A0A8J6XEH7_9CYAN|nr:hypothetical protein [Iningainema tapete]MBD2772238.1 hypothetical protein [Iningainema tapete BLCC-T55]